MTESKKKDRKGRKKGNKKGQKEKESDPSAGKEKFMRGAVCPVPLLFYFVFSDCSRDPRTVTFSSC